MTDSTKLQLRPAFPGRGQAVVLVLAFLGVQIAAGVAVAVGMNVMATLRKGGGGATEMPLAATLGANALAFAVIAGWALAATRGQWREILRGGRAGCVSWLAALPMLVGTTLLVTECSNLLQMVLPLSASMERILRAVVDLSAQPVVAVLLVAVLAPIGEEFLFRGIILRGLLARMRPWRAIGLTTFLFAAMHLNPWQVPAGLGLGLLCGWVYLRTRSLGLCILLHFLNNIGALFADRLPWVIPGLDRQGGRVEHLPGWLVLTALAALGLGWALFRRSTRGLLEPPLLPASGSCAVTEPQPVVTKS